MIQKRNSMGDGDPIYKGHLHFRRDSPITKVLGGGCEYALRKCFWDINFLDNFNVSIHMRPASMFLLRR